MSTKKSILIAEDDPASARMLQLIFAARGMPANIATNVEETIAQLQTLQYAVLTLDASLASFDLDGLKSCVEALPYKIPIVIISGYDPETIQTVAIKVSAICILQKPVDIPLMTDIMSDIIRLDGQP